MMVFLKKHGRVFSFTLLFSFCIYSSILITIESGKKNYDNSLVLLANQFLHKHISLEPADDMPLGDISKYNGKYYMYFGPFPSIILMPFVLLFGKNFPQLAIGIISMILSFIAVYSIAKSFKFKTVDSLFLSIFFVFSTVMFSSGLINITAYQVEVLGVPLVLLSLREYFSKKRFFLIGIFLGLAVMTRTLLLIGIVFFILEFLQKRIKPKQFIVFLIPIIISSSFVGLYNYVRFNSIFETGIKYSILADSYPLSWNLKYGYFNPIHIPSNLYSLFVMPPVPLLKNPHGFVLQYPYLKANPWGMAIWFTSPLFLVLFYKFKKGKYTVSAGITVILLLVPLLLFYSVGFAQFGYRYALDFLPFLFLLLLTSLQPRLSSKDIILISIGVIFNALYITSSWGVYPVLGIYH